jgi:hypothetical protein
VTQTPKSSARDGYEAEWRLRWNFAWTLERYIEYFKMQFCDVFELESRCDEAMRTSHGQQPGTIDGKH